MDEQDGTGHRANVRPDPSAQVVELGRSGLTSLEAIDRRRLELWIVTTVVVAVVGIALLLSATPDHAEMLSLPPGLLRGGIVVLALAFCGYAIEKELTLRRLTRALLDERLLTSSLTNRLSELSTLLSASRAMNSVLDLEEVLDIILTSALELLEAEGGSVMLTESAEELRVVASHGNPEAAGARVPVGSGIAGRVAETREPILITGEPTLEQFPGRRLRSKRVQSAMCVPLVHRDELLGVLSVNASPEHLFTEHDLRALSVFAEQGAGAIANARLYQIQQEHLGRMVEVDRMKSEFITSVNHDLRTPLTMLLGGAALARRPGIDPEQREKFLEAIERQGRHLASMIDAMLTAADLEQRNHPLHGASADLASVARLVALDFQALGRSVEVDAPESCPVAGDERALRRILMNLLDNAFKHGAPPVRIEIEPDEDHVVLSVVDSGPGVPQEHRERIFDRFFRLDPNRTLPGMGLGLSIVRTLVAGLGGTIAFEDAPDAGTAVRMTLRTAGIPLEIDTAETEDRAQTGG